MPYTKRNSRPPGRFDPQKRIEELQSFLQDESYARFKPDIEEAIHLYTTRQLPKLRTPRAIIQHGKMVVSLDKVDYNRGLWVEVWILSLFLHL